jgi:hypothetical protein
MHGRHKAGFNGFEGRVTAKCRESAHINHGGWRSSEKGTPGFYFVTQRTGLLTHLKYGRKGMMQKVLTIRRGRRWSKEEMLCCCARLYEGYAHAEGTQYTKDRR